MTEWFDVQPDDQESTDQLDQQDTTQEEEYADDYTEVQEDQTVETAAPEAPQKLAGGFNSVSDLETAYKSLQGEFTRRSQLLKEYENFVQSTKQPQAPASPENEATREIDLTDLVKEQYPDDVAIHQLADQVVALKQHVSKQQQQAALTNTEQVKREIKSFAEANKNWLDDPALSQEFLDDINDRLPPNVDFLQIVQAASNGVPMPDWVVSTLPKKINATLKSIGRVANKQTAKKEADVRVAQRAGTVAATPQAATPKMPEAKTFDEAYAQVRRLGFQK